jgi:hypothetical protein
VVSGDAATDADGIATLIFTAPETIAEDEWFGLDVIASHDDFSWSVSSSVEVKVLQNKLVEPHPQSIPPSFIITICVVSIAVLAAAGFLLRRRKP